MIQRAWVSHMCDTYALSVRRATGDTDMCHLDFFEGADGCDNYDDVDDGDDDDDG